MPQQIYLEERYLELLRIGAYRKNLSLSKFIQQILYAYAEKIEFLREDEIKSYHAYLEQQHFNKRKKSEISPDIFDKIKSIEIKKEEQKENNIDEVKKMQEDYDKKQIEEELNELKKIYQTHNKDFDKLKKDFIKYRLPNLNERLLKKLTTLEYNTLIEKIKNVS